MVRSLAKRASSKPSRAKKKDFKEVQSFLAARRCPGVSMMMLVRRRWCISLLSSRSPKVLEMPLKRVHKLLFRFRHPRAIELSFMQATGFLSSNHVCLPSQTPPHFIGSSMRACPWIALIGWSHDSVGEFDRSRTCQMFQMRDGVSSLLKRRSLIRAAHRSARAK